MINGPHFPKQQPAIHGCEQLCGCLLTLAGSVKHALSAQTAIDERASERMDPEYHEQLQRLQQVRTCLSGARGREHHVRNEADDLHKFRRSRAEQDMQTAVVSSATDDRPTGDALQYESGTRKAALGSNIENEPVNDPLIFRVYTLLVALI